MLSSDFPKNLLLLNNINYSYHSARAETPALRDISFQIREGEFVSLVGPSGCGKSTLLSIISGLIKPESGTLEFNSSQNKNMGYMLQQDHLLEWRSIYQNVLLGPEINHSITEDTYKLADKLLTQYGLWDFRHSHPSELSGGMRQRVALIRTMMMKPKLLLLDEPFSALDYQTRLRVSADICNIIRMNEMTALLVTHDLSEAVALSDRVIILSARPATVKTSMEIQLDKHDANPLTVRNAPEFRKYFKLLWSEVSDDVKE